MMIKKRILNGLLAVALGALVLNPLVSAPASAKDLLTVDLINEPSTLDPQLQWNPDSYYVYRNIFDNLLTRDDKGEIAPEIAVEWKYLSDTEIELTLRDDVTFHDGQKLTAEDVVYSVKRITDPKLASPQLGQFNKIVDATVTGDNKVVLKTDGPYPALLAQLVKLSIVPKHIVEKVGKDAFNLNPVGSGPYKFAGWQRGVSVALDRNDAYWGTKGTFPKAVFRAVPDSATRLANVMAGAADLVVTLDSDQAAQLETNAVAKPLSVLTERVTFMRLNPNKAPLDNLSIRQAVAYAIDKQGITEGLLGDYDKPASEFLTPAHFGWVEGIDALPYNPEKAKELVAAAGDAAKEKIVLAVGSAVDARVVQALGQMITDVGLNVSIETTDMATYIKRMQSGTENSPGLSVGRWSCACQDADGILFPVLESSNDWSVYRNPTVDKLLNDARSTLDPAKRLEAYKQVHEIVATDIPLIPVYQVASIYGAAKNLEWQPTPNESLFLNRMKWND